MPIDDKSPYYPHDSGATEVIPLFERQQWHCWMCITGTVRRSIDNHLIHCNIDTDLQIESQVTKQSKVDIQCCSRSYIQSCRKLFQLNRRLHLVPSKLGYSTPIRLRAGWVIMGPDVLINNFDPVKYNEELYAKSMIKYKPNNGIAANTNTTTTTQFLVPQTNEIEDLRPKSPIISTK